MMMTQALLPLIIALSPLNLTVEAESNASLLVKRGDHNNNYVNYGSHHWNYGNPRFNPNDPYPYQSSESDHVNDPSIEHNQFEQLNQGDDFINQWNSNQQNFNQWGANSWNQNMDHLTSMTQGLTLRMPSGNDDMHQAMPSGSMTSRPRPRTVEDEPSGSSTSRPRHGLKKLLSRKKTRNPTLPAQEEEPYNVSEQEVEVRRQGYENLRYEGELERYPNDEYRQLEYAFAQKKIVTGDDQPPLDLDTWFRLLAKQDDTAMLVRKMYRHRALAPLKATARYFFFVEKKDQESTQDTMKEYAYTKAYLKKYASYEVGGIREYLALVARGSRTVKKALVHYEEVKDQPWVTFDFRTDDDDGNDFEGQMPNYDDDGNE